VAPHIRRVCPTCEEDELRRQPIKEEEEEEEELLQTKEISEQNAETTSDLESRINAIRGGGQPLAESELKFFEPRFGYDFSQVRVQFGLQCTEFVRQVLDAAGSDTALGFGLIWESPNALDTWIRGNALLLGISVTGATSATGGQGGGAVGLDITYTHRFFSALSNKLRLHWMSRGEYSSRMASLSTGVGLEVTTQRVFLPSLYLFGGGIAGEITPGKLGRAGEKLGAGTELLWRRVSPRVRGQTLLEVD